MALRLLSPQQPDVEILGGAVYTTGLLDWLEAANPDLILLDWELPELPAVALLPLLHFHRPGPPVVALSGRPEARPATLEARVTVLVSKGDPPGVLVAGVDVCRREKTQREPIRLNR